MSSRQLEDGVNTHLPQAKRGVPDSRISVVEAFSLATLGGGEALDLPIGLIKEGYAADFQVIDTTAKENRIQGFGVFEDLGQTFEKILYLANQANIQQVYVQGKLVSEK